MFTFNETLESDVTLAPRGPRSAGRAAANAPDFAATEFMLTHVDEGEAVSGTVATMPGRVRSRAPITLVKPVARSPRLSAVTPAASSPEAPRTGSEAMLAAWSTARWVEEQEAIAAAAARRAAAAPQRRAPDFRSARQVARDAARRRGNWLLRFEAALHRLLPAGFGSLLGLFLCVSLSMALISSMLPLVDRF